MLPTFIYPVSNSVYSSISRVLPTNISDVTDVDRVAALSLSLCVCVCVCVSERFHDPVRGAVNLISNVIRRNHSELTS